MNTIYTLPERSNKRRKSSWAWIALLLIALIMVTQTDSTKNYSPKESVDWDAVGRRYVHLRSVDKVKAMILHLKPGVENLDELAEAIVIAGHCYNIPHDKHVAKIFRESSFRQYAVSIANCVGYSQINPAVHPWIDPDMMFDTYYNIMAGARILREYRDMSDCWEEAFIRYNGWVPGSTFGQWVLNIAEEVRYVR